MIRRAQDADSGGAARAAGIGVEALDHLGRLSGLVEYLLERRGGYPAPLDAWLSCGGRWSSPKTRAMWDRVVGAIVLTGEMLGRTLPATEEGRDHRVGAELIIRWLQDGVEETLKDLWDYWPHVRDDLLRYVRLQVRRDDPKDVRPIDGAARACGLSLQTPPASARLALAVRGVLVELIFCAGTEVTRAELRQLLARVSGIRGPRRARYALARALATYAGRDQDRRIEDYAFLGDPGRSPPPPAVLVDRALLLLGAADVSEAGGAPGLLWRGRSAYGVLRKVATKPVWVDELRDAADAVLAGSLEVEAVVGVVEAAIEPPPPVAATDTTGPSIRAAPKRNVEGDERAEAANSSATRASHEVEGSVATGGVSSPAPASAEVWNQAADGRRAATPVGGDETSALEAASEAGTARVSSPVRPAEEVRARGSSPRAPTGGDGTETSEAASHAGLAEVSSPGGLRAGSPAARAGQEKKDSDAASAGTPRSPQPPGPEGLALAHLMLAVRDGRPVPSRAECARAAGVSRQATMKWNSFDAAWRNARATEKSHVRRGYRDARTGDVEAEDDGG